MNGYLTANIELREQLQTLKKMHADLLEKNRNLRLETERLQIQLNGANVMLAALVGRREYLEASLHNRDVALEAYRIENEQLRAALAQYADPANWVLRNHYIGFAGRGVHKEIADAWGIEGPDGFPVNGYELAQKALGPDGAK